MKVTATLYLAMTTLKEQKSDWNLFFSFSKILAEAVIVLEIDDSGRE